MSAVEITRNFFIVYELKQTFNSESYFLQTPLFQHLFSHISVFDVLEKSVQMCTVHNWKTNNYLCHDNVNVYIMSTMVKTINKVAHSEYKY